MPESVTDRPTKSHEYIFLLTKSAKYYYDAEAVKEDGVTDHMPGQRITDTRLTHGTGGGNTGIANAMAKMKSGELIGRNRRSVWEITTQPFKGAHFATFPEEIPTICIKAGTSEKGQCAKCGKPIKRVVDHGETSKHESENQTVSSGRGENADRTKHAEPRASTTLGWKPQCTCNAGTVPQIVLDPFCGSGTSIEVAKRLGRDFIGIELNPKYVKELIEPRMANIDPLFNLPVPSFPEKD
jgi:hypothetical protein